MSASFDFAVSLDRILANDEQLRRAQRTALQALRTMEHPSTAPAFTAIDEVYEFIEKLQPIVESLLEVRAPPYEPYIQIPNLWSAAQERATDKQLTEFRAALSANNERAQTAWEILFQDRTCEPYLFDRGSVRRSVVLNRYSAAPVLAHELTHHIIARNSNSIVSPNFYEAWNHSEYRTHPQNAWEEAICHAVTLAIPQHLEADERYHFGGTLATAATFQRYQKDNSQEIHVRGYAAATLLTETLGAKAPRALYTGEVE